ncbi:MAG: class I SAM-dependent methyltransferase [Halapricum sp.]
MQPFQNTGQPDWEWWSKLWPSPGATLRALGLAAGDTLAEVPCGNGYFALPAARITDPARVYALDLDEAMLEELAHLADQQEIETIEPIHGDARALARHLPERVDVVLVANTVHGVDDIAGFIRQATTSLRPGGRLIILNWHDRPRARTTLAGEPRGPPTDLRMSPAETEAVVEDAADLAQAEQHDLPPYHYGLVFER